PCFLSRLRSQPSPSLFPYTTLFRSFVTLLVAAGARSVPGVLMLPLEGEFGWNRATLSLAVSINLFLYGLCGPFAAAFMERFGMRDRKSTRLNSSHQITSYAVFCLKK